MSQSQYLYITKEWIIKYVRAFPKISGVLPDTPTPKRPWYYDTPDQETEWAPFYKGFLHVLKSPVAEIILISNKGAHPAGVEQSMHMTGQFANQVAADVRNLLKKRLEKRET